MVFTAVTGIWLINYHPLKTTYWLHLKLALLVLLFGYHFWCGVIRKQLAAGGIPMTAAKLRAFNEVPTFLLVTIVFTAVGGPRQVLAFSCGYLLGGWWGGIVSTLLTGLGALLTMSVIKHAGMDWLRQRPLALHTHGWLMVHAGVLPQWTVAQTLALAEGFSALLRGPEGPAWLHRMYGNKPVQWRDDRVFKVGGKMFAVIGARDPLAVRVGRMTVAVPMPKTSAVSSMERPPKKRSSTTRACCGSTPSRWESARSTEMMSTSGGASTTAKSASVTRTSPPPRFWARRARA